MRAPWPLLLALDACTFRPPVSAVEGDAQEADAAVLEKDAEEERDADVIDASAGDAGQLANDAAFPDAAPECISGTLCSDDDFCTSDDFCADSICIGQVLTGTCADSCDQGCSTGTGGCCTERCGNGSPCSDCAAGRSCETTCERDCDTTCRTGSACRLSHDLPEESSTNTVVVCETGASCELSCDGGSEVYYNCVLQCAHGSRCLLSCSSNDRCDLECNGGARLDCGSNTYACGRDCP